jgi:hypothetical protein
MKKNKKVIKNEIESQKILLHIAKRKGVWRGKATNFTARREFKFAHFQEFIDWLEKYSEEDRKV